MIDAEGTELHVKMMKILMHDDNSITKEENDAMVAFDVHMNKINHTTAMFYGADGEVLMEL